MYLDGCFQLQQNGLRDEDFSRLSAEKANLRFQELNLLSRPATPHLQQTVNDRVQIHFLVSHGDMVLMGQQKSNKKWKTKKTMVVKQRRLATKKKSAWYDR